MSDLPRLAAPRRRTQPSSARQIACAAALVLGVGSLGGPALGCARSQPVRLLDVSGVGPARIERGELLRVSGAGFPSGRPVRLRLEGVVQRPTVAGQPVDITLVGQAVSPDRVETRVDEAMLDRLGGGGTFRGRAELSFDAVVRDAEPVSGTREGVVVLFVASTDRRLPTELDHARAASEWLTFLGVRCSTDAGTDGVQLEQVGAQSRAAVAGLRVGDVVVESDGVIVTSLEDLAPMPTARAAHWRVTRAGESMPLALTLSLRGFGGAPDPEWSWAAVLIALVWLVVLLRVAPPSRLASTAHRALCAAWRAPAPRQDVVGGLLAGLLVALVAAVPRVPTVIDAVSVYGALFALRLVGAVRGGPVGRRARLTQALGLEVAAGLALAAILAPAGTARFAGLAADQALAPFTLGALSGPVPLVASVLWLRVACVPTARASASAGTLIDGESVRRSLAVAVITLVAFGGAASTATGAPYPRGALLIGPLATGIFLMVSRFRGLDPVRALRALALGAGALLGALGVILVPLPASVVVMLSRACVTLVLGASLIAGVSLWRRPRSTPLHSAEPK